MCIFVTYIYVLPEIITRFVIIYLPSCRSKLDSFFCWTQNNFEEPVSYWSPLASIVEKEILWKSIGTINWLPAFFKIYFYVQHNKETHTGLEQHEGE